MSWDRIRLQQAVASPRPGGLADGSEAVADGGSLAFMGYYQGLDCHNISKTAVLKDDSHCGLMTPWKWQSS